MSGVGSSTLQTRAHEWRFEKVPRVLHVAGMMREFSCRRSQALPVGRVSLPSHCGNRCMGLLRALCVQAYVNGALKVRTK